MIERVPRSSNDNRLPFSLSLDGAADFYSGMPGGGIGVFLQLSRASMSDLPFVVRFGLTIMSQSKPIRKLHRFALPCKLEVGSACDALLFCFLLSVARFACCRFHVSPASFCMLFPRHAPFRLTFRQLHSFTLQVASMLQACYKQARLALLLSCLMPVILLAVGLLFPRHHFACCRCVVSPGW
jgi:hypothetical protein